MAVIQLSRSFAIRIRFLSRSIPSSHQEIAERTSRSDAAARSTAAGIPGATFWTLPSVSQIQIWVSSSRSGSVAVGIPVDVDRRENVTLVGDLT